MNGRAEKREMPCAGCGKPAEPDDGLCRECAEMLNRLACVFEGREEERR